MIENVKNVIIENVERLFIGIDNFTLVTKITLGYAELSIVKIGLTFFEFFLYLSFKIFSNAKD